MAQLGLGSEESMRERKFPTVVKVGFALFVLFFGIEYLKFSPA